MSIEQTIVYSTTIYKLASLGVGALFCILGFYLFKLGIWGQAGDLDVKFKDTKLVLKSAAPGTFLALLGAFIIIFTIIQGMNYNWKSNSEGTSISNMGQKPPLP